MSTVMTSAMMSMYNSEGDLDPTSDDGLAALVTYFLTLMPEDEDETGSLDSVKSILRAVTLDGLSDEWETLGEKWTAFQDAADSEDENGNAITTAYDATFDYDKTLGDVSDLPTGLSISIPTSTVYINVSQNEGATIGNIDANADVSASVALDMDDFLNDDDLSSMIKALKANIAFKSSLEATDLDITKDETDADNLAKMNISFDCATNVGVVFCVPEYDDNGETTDTTIGGKIIASVEASYDGTATELYALEEAIDYYEGYGNSEALEEALADCPLTISVSAKVYDDSDTLTYTILDASSLSDLYTSVMTMMDSMSAE